MQTQLLSGPEAPARAARLLAAGELVAIPTETVYGLAANALDAQAVAKIFAAKGRPQDNPLIVHIASLAQLEELTCHLPPQALALAQAFWPGPLTLVLPKSEPVPTVTTGGLPSVAVRMPAHSMALELLSACGLPLAAPSANRSGSPSPTTAQHCMADLSGRIAAVLEGGPCRVGVESTVLSLVTPVPTLLRPGAVTPDMLRGVLGELEEHPSLTKELQPGQAAASPGMKYRHYAPCAQVTLLQGDAAAFGRYLAQQAEPGVYALCFEEDIPHLGNTPYLCYGAKADAAAQAAGLFAALRRLDELGAQRVYAHSPTAHGLGLAVYNRLLRAAGFRQIELQASEDAL